MRYEVILLVLGILLLLVGLVGKVKVPEFEIGIISRIQRIIIALVGIFLGALSFNSDITKTFLSTPPKQMGEDTQGGHQELKEIEKAHFAKEQHLKEAKEARLAEELLLRKAKEERLAEEERLKEAKDAHLAEQELFAEELRLKDAKEARLAEEQRRITEQAHLAEEQRRITEQAHLAEEKQRIIEQTRFAQEQLRIAEQARLAEEQQLIVLPRGAAIIEGKIIFKGDPPPPKKFELSKFPNSEFCEQVDNDGQGNRILKQVTVKDGKLQDVVVSIKGITGGKLMNFKGTDVLADKCRFLVQNGPSTFVGVVVNKDRIRVLNNDADPNDPEAADGVLHNPHAYEIVGTKSSTMFNLLLPTKGQTVDQKVKLRKEKKGSFMKLECDQHNYMNTWFYPIKNPYYAIIGQEGTYSIDQVPPGKYKILAWHPILGTQEQEIRVGTTGKLMVNFEFSEKSK